MVKSESTPAPSVEAITEASSASSHLEHEMQQAASNSGLQDEQTVKPVHIICSYIFAY